MYSDAYFAGLEEVLGADGMEMAMVAIAVIMVLYVLIMTVSLLNYIFTSVALCSVGKRRGLKNYGLAWLPLGGQQWLMGAIADQYDRKAKGRDMKLGKFLLIGYIVITVVTVAAMVALFAGAIGMETVEMMGGAASSGSIAAEIVGMILLLLVFPFAIVWSVFWYIAFFKFFRSCSPKNAVWMLVLSIVIGGLFTSICMLCVCKKDGGFEELQQAAAEEVPAEEPALITEPEVDAE